MKSQRLALKHLLPFLCFFFALTGQVAASPVLVKEIGLSSGMYAGSLTLPVSGSSQNYFSGLQILQVDNTDNLLAFCIDPFQWSPVSNTTYNVSSDFNGYFGADSADVAKLYSLFYTATLGNNLNAAGFQLALWELIADSSKDLNAGQVRTNAGTNASIKATAQSMLDALAGNGGSDQFIYEIYSSASNQDYLVVSLNENQVPEPGVHALFVLALAGMLVAMRRRN